MYSTYKMFRSAMIHQQIIREIHSVWIVVTLVFVLML